MTVHAQLPMSLQVVIGVIVGVTLGVTFGTHSYLFGSLTNDMLGQLGMLVIRSLKTLATPLIFFAILDAFLKTDITFKHAKRLVGACSFNLLVAMCIGLSILTIFEPGLRWQGHLDALSLQVVNSGVSTAAKATPENASLDVVKNLSGFIPDSILDPFLHNNVVSIILLALLFGNALRALRQMPAVNAQGMETLANLIGVFYQLLMKALSWIIVAIPYAIAGVVAQVVGKSGIEVFMLLGIFLVTLLGGLILHAGIYYGAMAHWVGKMPVKRYWGQGAEAILMSFSTNSSLATVPVTLRCLTEKMGISERSARLSALIGTNLNNDGIMLYEAMTALFLAQALGFSLSLGEQLTIVAAAVMVGVGVSGIPEAGLAALPLVLNAIGLPEQVVITAIPLIATVDWIIARCRSVVNVMNDMLIAILLDRFEKR